MENPNFEKVDSWIKNSVLLKMIIIGVLGLLLLVPTFMIQSIIEERENLRTESVKDVSEKWATNQTICGPILTIPLLFATANSEVMKNLYIMPDQFKINGTINPVELSRGIYHIVVFGSKLNASGVFQIPAIGPNDNLKEIQWGKAFITIGITDVRGIESQLMIKWGDSTLKTEPGTRISKVIDAGVTASIPDLKEDFSEPIHFQFDLDLKGSHNLSFVPLGGNTTIALKSSWLNPSFNGSFLPTYREVSEDGFKATWNILEINRNFPKSLVETLVPGTLYQSSLGVNLLLGVDDYQKSIRSVKYAVMTIALTFLVFFLVEILNKKRIHPFQYALVGLALCLFYILLVAISEHLNFNLAYWIATLGIVLMIAFYSLSVFKSMKLTGMLSIVLFGIYGFLFVTLQLADYALLIGSLGLTIILALTMYFTRNINWYEWQLAAKGD